MVVTGIKLILIVTISVLWSSVAVITGPLNLFIPAYHVISRSWAKWLIRVSGIEIQTSGLDNIDVKQNYVFISNHASLFDIPILLSTVKNEIKMIAKKELAYIPIFGWSLIAGGYILIDRNNTRKTLRAMGKARKKLKKGTSILVFPEGTRSINGSIQAFKKGAFLLAFQTQLDIVPISIIGSHRVMPKKTFQLTPARIRIVVDKPISIKEVKSAQKQVLIDQVRDLIINNCQEKKL